MMYCGSTLSIPTARDTSWDNFKFPKPKEMQQLLAQTGRKMVTIVDPHIKKDSNYKVYQEAHEKGLFIQKPDGSELDGWCWPGSSAYLDFTSSMVRDWWAGRFAYDKYEGSTETLYTWNDMNEPSVFNGPEVSMDKDAKSLAGIEHREWHNLYGMYMQQATAMGLLTAQPKAGQAAIRALAVLLCGLAEMGCHLDG